MYWFPLRWVTLVYPKLAWPFVHSVEVRMSNIPWFMNTVRNHASGKYLPGHAVFLTKPSMFWWGTPQIQPNIDTTQLGCIQAGLCLYWTGYSFIDKNPSLQYQKWSLVRDNCLVKVAPLLPTICIRRQPVYGNTFSYMVFIDMLSCIQTLVEINCVFKPEYTELVGIAV